jgi:hypothetical protein
MKITTWADIEAENLLIKAGVVPMTTKQHSPTQSGNYIIALAEKIKAQRLTLAIQKNSVKIIKTDETCHICNWTNVGLLNLGEPDKPKWTCQGCCKRILDVIEPQEEE